MTAKSKSRFWGPFPIRPIECIVAGIVTSWFVIVVWAIVGFAWFSLSGDLNVLYVLGSARVWAAIFIFGSAFFTIVFAWADSQVPHR